MIKRIAIGCAAVLIATIGANRLGRADNSYAQIERGRYLVQAGDCAACHTAEGGKPFAGGRAIPTPFGTIYSTNITPDNETGIGAWSEQDFYKAMHEGIRRDGKHLYPAFPYPWYTRFTRDDVDAIKSYLDTLAPVRQTNRAPDLPWPLSIRESVAAWNALFFDEGTYRPDPNKSAEWNRGAYLVEGAGHCSSCHSPKNLAGAVKDDEKFTGGYGEHWYAVNLTNDVHDGLGDWSLADIVEYLKSGSNRKAAAAGPMAEVIEHSTQHLSEPDLRAMAVYLKDLRSTGTAHTAQSDIDRKVLARGRALYLDQCTGCHMENGEGLPGVFPPLKGNAIVQARDAQTLVHTILSGAKTAATGEKPTGLAMPAFDWKLDDDDIAALATYVRNAWGNHASIVSHDKVADTRNTVTHAAR